MRVVEQQVEASFIRKKQEAKLKAECLKLEGDMTKAQTRTKILSEENLDQKLPLEMTKK